jgi:hypothetical protein
MGGFTVNLKRWRGGLWGVYGMAAMSIYLGWLCELV